jgi:hypothetical protein
MQQAFVLGSAVECTDGTGGRISRIVFNPNTSHLDYLVVHPGQNDGREHFVAVRCIRDGSPKVARLRVSTTELNELPPVDVQPRDPVEATVHSNLDDLCVADEHTPVKDADGAVLGQFRGVVVDANFDVARILLQGQDDAGLAVARLAGHGEHELVIQLAREVAGA